MTAKIEVTGLEKRARKQPRGYDPKAVRAYYKDARIYIFHNNESLLENFGARAARPVVLYRDILPDILKAIGVGPDRKVRWSRKAGCACGCSPGFIVEGASGFDVYVDVTGKNVTDDPKKLAVANDRIGQLLSDPTVVGSATPTQEG